MRLTNRSYILVTHVPIEPAVENTLWEKSNEVWKAADNGHSRVLLGPSSCVPNAVTAEFLDMVMAAESPILLVLSGHIHFYHRDNLTKDLVQVVTGAGFQKEMVKVTLLPDNNQ